MAIPLDKHDLLLLHVTKNEALFKHALKIVKSGVDLFPEAQRPHLACFWKTYLIKKVESKKAAKPLDSQDLVAAVIENMQAVEMLDENRAKLEQLCSKYLDNEELDIDTGKQYLKDELQEAAKRQIAKAVFSAKAFERIKDIVNTGAALQKTINEDTKSELFTNPLMDVEKYLEPIPKLSTGVNYFDKSTGGGMSAGEVCLIGGVTGGGKSMNTIQLVGSQLLMGNAVGWFTYEQPFDQDLMQRLVSFLTGYELDKIRTTRFQDLPEDIRTRWNATTAGMQDKLVAVDFSTDRMLDKEDTSDDYGSYSIRKRLDIIKNQGRHLEYVVVDWLGQAVMKIGSMRNVDTSEISKFQGIARELINDLVQIAKDFDTRIVIFHQLKPEIKQAPASRKPTSADLQLMKAAPNWVNYAVVMGKQDENHRCWWICDKCRNAFPSEYVIELDGAHAKFKLLHGYTPGRNGTFININEEEQINGKNVDGPTADYEPLL